MPRIVLRAKANGDTTAEIARELDMTDSYVRRIAREHRHVSWRLDLYDGEAGPGWQPYEEGVDIIPTTHTEAQLAKNILTAAGRGPLERDARVLVWNGTDKQSDDAAVYTHEQRVGTLGCREVFAAGTQKHPEDEEQERKAGHRGTSKAGQRWRLDRQWDADNLPTGEWHIVREGGPIVGGQPRTDAELAAYLVDRERRHQHAEARLRVTV